jgi:hypothetical protein
MVKISDFAHGSQFGSLEYFFYVEFGKEKLIAKLKSDQYFPVQFGRYSPWVKVLIFCRKVVTECLGCPEKLDWKACAVGKKGEEESAKKFQERYNVVGS